MGTNDRGSRVDPTEFFLADVPLHDVGRFRLSFRPSPASVPIESAAAQIATGNNHWIVAVFLRHLGRP